MERILQSIAAAKERGATLRVGPELEIPYVLMSKCQLRLTLSAYSSGYGCLDHFLEGILFNNPYLPTLDFLYFFQGILCYTHGRYWPRS